MPRVAQPEDNRCHFYCRCLRCGYIWISPCPSPQRLPRVCPRCKRVTWRKHEGTGPLRMTATQIVNPFVD